MMSEKVIKMLSQLIMMIMLARFLGPTDLGTLMYCFALTSTFVFLNTLGLDSLLVKIFIDNVKEQHSYLRHALLLRIIGALICIALVNLVGFWLIDEQHRFLLFVVSLYHLFLPLTVYEWFYQAQGRADLSAAALIISHTGSFVFRIACLFLGGDLVWLGLAYSVEMLLMAVSFGFITKKQNIPLRGAVSSERLFNLAKSASPLIISGALVLLYMKTDQLMLGYIVDEAEVGIYVAAIRLSEAWYFIGLTLIGVYFPKLLETLKNNGQEAYHAEIVKKCRKLIWAAIALALVTTLMAEVIILLLYGSAYKQSATVLIITIWAVPFVYLGTISTKMYIVIGDKKSILYRSIIGLLINLILNYIMIPHWGAQGAGIASLVAQIFACYIFNASNSKNKIFVIQSKVLFLIDRRES